MTAPLTPDQRQKLAKLLAMLGSSHAGERDAAGLAAHRLVVNAGASWSDVVNPPALPPYRQPEPKPHWRRPQPEPQPDYNDHASSWAGEPQWPPRTPSYQRWEPTVADLQSRPDLLTAWERSFLENIDGRWPPSDRQWACLGDIVRRAMEREQQRSGRRS
jgi:hypothetical protein